MLQNAVLVKPNILFSFIEKLIYQCCPTFIYTLSCQSNSSILNKSKQLINVHIRNVFRREAPSGHASNTGKIQVQ